MSSAPKDDPMDDLPTAVAQFEEDVARIDIFVNGTETEDYTTEDARLVPSLSKVVANVNAMIAPDLVAIDQAVTTATTAASNAAASASSAHTDATTADNAADLAEGYSTSASAAASNATDSAVRAESAATAAGTARDAAAASQTAAKTSETNSAANASAAGQSKDAANVSATAAANSATNAGTAATTATTKASAADVSAQAAAASQVAAHTSETNSGASATAAAQSASDAAASAASINPANLVPIDASRAMTAPLKTPGLAIQGNANRITGVLDSVPYAQRALFQTSTANMPSSVGVIPNGSGVGASVFAFGSSNPDQSGIMYLYHDGTNGVLSSTRSGAANYGAMTFQTGAAERFRLASDANRFQADFQNGTLANRLLFQAIGPNVPTSLGVVPNGTGVGGNVTVFHSSNPDNSAFIQIGHDGTVGTIGVSYTATGGSAGSTPLRFNTAGVERVRIGIDGITQFNGPIRLSATGAISTQLYLQAGSYAPHFRSTSSYSGAFEWVNGANTAVIMRLLDTGNLYLGTNPGNFTKLNIANFGPNYGAGIICAPIVDGAWPMAFLSVGGADAGHIGISGTTTAYGTTSDYRLKTNVEDLAGSLERVMECRPVSFDWISDGRSARGFIAHELQPIEPDAVMGEKDGTRRNAEKQEEPEYQCVDLSFLVPDLVGAIQALKAEVDELRAELAVLIDPLKRAQ